MACGKTTRRTLLSLFGIALMAFGLLACVLWQSHARGAERHEEVASSTQPDSMFMPKGGLPLDLGDLGAFQADAGHEAALVEDHGIDVLAQRGGTGLHPKAVFEDDDARPGSDLPAV